MNPVRPDHPLAPDAAANRWRGLLRERLHAMGIPAAPEAGPGDIQRVVDTEALLAQFVRAARHTSGAVRAYSSLISDAHADDADTQHWTARVSHAARELDEFSGRVSALRLCDDERASRLTWRGILGRVGDRCERVAPCVIDMVDRTHGEFRQRGELLTRILFHILRNAMEASPRAGRVRVRVDDSRIDGARVFHARVSDEGEGVDAAQQDAIWKPFVTSKRGHAGLGLAYVAAAAPRTAAVAGMRREGGRTVVHLLVGEEGGLQWD
ncbi:MAG TPA: ATP-binding protein [Candidatus Krumholzibacteria bacterium]|nr:ATP-binding protein [Candidatus Krumholzibacteria bacterium]